MASTRGPLARVVCAWGKRRSARASIWPTGCGRGGRSRGALSKSWPAGCGLGVWSLLVLLLSVSAVGAEPFLDIYFGKAFPLESDLTVRQPEYDTHYTVHDVSFRDESFQLPVYYGLRAGYFFDTFPAFGIALDYFHFKILANTQEDKRITGQRQGTALDVVQPVGTTIQSFNVTHGVNYITLDALLRTEIALSRTSGWPGRVQGYVGAGPGVVVVHPENIVEGMRNQPRYAIGGFGFQAFGGAKWLVSKYVGVFGEYKVTHSRLRVDLRVGDARVTELTHHLTFGVTVPLRW